MEKRFRYLHEDPLPSFISMMVTINMMEVAQYTFREFKEEDIQDMGFLYQIALEVSRRNEEAINEAEHGAKDDDDTVPDSPEQLDFFNSLREER